MPVADPDESASPMAAAVTASRKLETKAWSCKETRFDVFGSGVGMGEVGVDRRISKTKHAGGSWDGQDKKRLYYVLSRSIHALQRSSSRSMVTNEGASC